MIIFLSNLGKKPPKQHTNLIIEKEKCYQMFSVLQFKKLNFLVTSSSALYSTFGHSVSDITSPPNLIFSLHMFSKEICKIS